MKFTVCLLLYGDYPHLAQQALGSILQKRWADQFVDLRLGYNQISDTTREICNVLFDLWPGDVHIWDSPTNLGKYPLMRRMFTEHPLEQPLVMWFDDDSRISSTAPDDWPQSVATQMEQYSMIGSLWQPRHPLTAEELACLNAKPWSTGRPTPPKLKFITGGWWTIRTEILLKHDWPPPDMHHNGGDLSLSHLCWQQGYELGTFRQHLAINADHTGKDSSAQRRGLSQYPYFHAKSGQPK